MGALVDRTWVAESQWTVTVRPPAGEVESARVQLSELVVRIGFEDDVTEDEAQEHTRDLVLLMEGLDVDEVGAAQGESVTGTRSADPAVLAGAVVVAGALLKPVLTALVTLLGNWIEQSGQRSVTVELGEAKVTVKGRAAVQEVEAYVRALNEGRNPRGTSEDGD